MANLLPKGFKWFSELVGRTLDDTGLMEIENAARIAKKKPWVEGNTCSSFSQ